MEIIPENKAGTFVYVYDDYLYSVDGRYNNVYRCSSRKSLKCPGCVVVKDNNVEISREHNHEKMPFIKVQNDMKKEMLKLARETSTGLKEIFDTVCRSSMLYLFRNIKLFFNILFSRNQDAAQYLSFPSVRYTMHRERMKNRPSIPTTLASLYNMLQSSTIMQNIRKETVITTGEKTAIIFSTNDLLQALSSATEIYVDGTFSVLPRVPHIAQLYSIHIRHMNTGIATIFILCDVRTTAVYDALWDRIMQLVPQLQHNIKFIMSDFEMAAVKSLSKKFPRANLTGCWFHFNQAVLRKWRQLRISNIPKVVLSMTMTLPLLPPDMFQEALLIIQTEADRLPNEYPDILQFMSYLRLTWLNMASKISTYHCPARTNNIVESFHNIAAQKLGTTNINVWTFLGNAY
ncbi:uncharacterized protein [Cardiocondyla obscurior]|uniref:uncharacterized protein n=1 Tax=Cardiocondyla obscurior TaxID=286306 RepID=UPI0039656FC1